MATISLIAAIDEHYGLGKNNQLLCHLPADLAHFKSITMGKPIVMGRRTFDSIGKPLPGRQNIILSRTEKTIPGAEVFHSLEQIMEVTKTAPEVMIIGGAELFKKAFPLATRLYLTIIHHQFDADVFFPDFKLSEWVCLERHFRPSDEKNPFDMTFYKYEKN